VLIGVPVMFWSRIILRLTIASDENRLSIDLINRFRWTVTTKTVLLSQTQIQTEHQEKTNYWLTRSTPEYFILHLTNKELGSIQISEQDFENMHEVVQMFEQLKSDTAKRIRLRKKR
jgi:hypothetical protein